MQTPHLSIERAWQTYCHAICQAWGDDTDWYIACYAQTDNFSEVDWDTPYMHLRPRASDHAFQIIKIGPLMLSTGNHFEDFHVNTCLLSHYPLPNEVTQW